MKVILFTSLNNPEKLAAVGRRGIQYPPVLPLFVPCIDVIAETHLLAAFERGADGVIPVSYTHLTLPTIYSV